jgi:hypothetical protein
MDARGQVVAQLSSTGDITSYAVSELSAGLYTVRVSDGRMSMAGRFLKE